MSGIGDRLEGMHAVAAALRAGRLTSLTVERSRAESAEVAQLIATAERSGVPVQLVDDVTQLATTTAPQGVVARARPMPTVSLRELVNPAAQPVLILLDHAEDPRNVGAIARSAVAAGAGGMVVSSRRSAPLGPTAFKAAAGAFEQLPIAVVTSIADAVRDLRRGGMWAVALDGAGDESFFGLEILAEPIAVVIGAEGRGVSRLVAERADVVARLPMAGDVDSLNAAVAAALALYEIARARGVFS